MLCCTTSTPFQCLDGHVFSIGLFNLEIYEFINLRNPHRRFFIRLISNMANAYCISNFLLVGAPAVDFQSKYYKPPEEPPSSAGGSPGSPPTATSPAYSSASPRPSTLPDQEAESGSLGKHQVTASRCTVGTASGVLRS